MPRGDRTGPLGLGPRTGRGMGYCSGFGAPGYLNRGPGRGLGFGAGLGRGFGRWLGGHCRWFFGPWLANWWGAPNPAGYGAAPLDETQERAILENEVRNLKAHLKRLEAQLARYEQEEKEE